MAQAGRWASGETGLLHLGRLLRQLSTLDDVLDNFFLLSSLFGITPPDRTFVVAAQTEMGASFTCRLTLLTLLSTESASETTFETH